MGPLGHMYSGGGEGGQAGGGARLEENGWARKLREEQSENMWSWVGNERVQEEFAERWRVWPEGARESPDQWSIGQANRQVA